MNKKQEKIIKEIEEIYKEFITKVKALNDQIDVQINGINKKAEEKQMEDIKKALKKS